MANNTSTPIDEDFSFDSIDDSAAPMDSSSADLGNDGVVFDSNPEGDFDILKEDNFDIDTDSGEILDELPEEPYTEEDEDGESFAGAAEEEELPEMDIPTFDDSGFDFGSFDGADGSDASGSDNEVGDFSDVAASTVFGNIPDDFIASSPANFANEPVPAESEESEDLVEDLDDSNAEQELDDISISVPSGEDVNLLNSDILEDNTSSNSDDWDVPLFDDTSMIEEAKSAGLDSDESQMDASNVVLPETTDMETDFTKFSSLNMDNVEAVEASMDLDMGDDSVYAQSDDDFVDDSFIVEAEGRSAGMAGDSEEPAPLPDFGEPEYEDASVTQEIILPSFEDTFAPDENAVNEAGLHTETIPLVDDSIESVVDDTEEYGAVADMSDFAMPDLSLDESADASDDGSSDGLADMSFDLPDLDSSNDTSDASADMSFDLPDTDESIDSNSDGLDLDMPDFGDTSDLDSDLGSGSDDLDLDMPDLDDNSDSSSDSFDLDMPDFGDTSDLDSDSGSSSDDLDLDMPDFGDTSDLDSSLDSGSDDMSFDMPDLDDNSGSSSDSLDLDMPDFDDNSDSSADGLDLDMPDLDDNSDSSADGLDLDIPDFGDTSDLDSSLDSGSYDMSFDMPDLDSDSGSSSDSLDLDMPDFSDTSALDNNTDSFAANDSFDLPDFDDDSPALSRAAPVGISGLFDDQDFGEVDLGVDGSDSNAFQNSNDDYSSLNDSSDDNRRSGFPMVVCIICAIICLAALGFMMFFIPSKIRDANSTSTSVTSTETVTGSEESTTSKSDKKNKKEDKKNKKDKAEEEQLTDEERLAKLNEALAKAEAEEKAEKEAAQNSQSADSSILSEEKKPDGNSAGTSKTDKTELKEPIANPPSPEEIAASTSTEATIIIEEKKSSTSAKEDEIVVATSPEQIVPVQPEKTATKAPDIRYKIQWGDTLWDIAEAYYKNPWRYTTIANYNGLRNPDRIVAGTWLLIPAE